MSNFFQLQDIGLATDPSTLLQQAVIYLQDIYPGYTPQSTSLEYIMGIIFASWASDFATLTSQGGTELFIQYGEQIIGLPMNIGQSATASVQVTAVDNSGYTIPSGTQFLLDNTAGFQTYNDIVIPAGSQTVTFTIAAMTPGTAANGLGSQSVALNQSFPWVLAVQSVTQSVGGVDPETPDQYVVRLAQNIQVASQTPITASDYAVMAKDFQPDIATDQQLVGRSAAIDGYNPVDGTSNNERMVTICVTDSNGLPLNADTKTALTAWFNSLREVGFIVNVIDPTYVPIYITVQVYRTLTYDAPTVQANIQSNLMGLLDPSTFGIAPDSSGTIWSNTPVIYQSVIESTIQQTTGVDHIVTGSLNMGTSPSPSGANDIALTGAFPLATTSAGSTIPLAGIQVLN